MIIDIFYVFLTTNITIEIKSYTLLKKKYIIQKLINKLNVIILMQYNMFSILNFINICTCDVCFEFKINNK